MALQNSDLFLVGRGSTPHKITYDNLKTKLETDGLGVPEAPADGKQYGRQNNNWTEITGGGGSFGVTDLDDFAYAPSSNTVTLAGPSTATDPSGAGAYRGYNATPNTITATIRFEKSTNTQFLDGINQLTAGDSITLGWNNAGTDTTTVTTFNSITETTILGVTYSELIVNSPLGTFGIGNYPFSVTSAQIINGTEPLNDGDVLRYDTATTKWTASSLGSSSSSSAGFLETPQTLVSDQDIDTSVNAICIGPVTVDTGITLTIGANSKLSVLYF